MEAGTSTVSKVSNSHFFHRWAVPSSSLRSSSCSSDLVGKKYPGNHSSTYQVFTDPFGTELDLTKASNPFYKAYGCGAMFGGGMRIGTVRNYM